VPFSVETTMPEKQLNIKQAVNSYGRQLLGFIRGKVNTDEDAEDVLQDVWYQLSNIDEIETIESLSGWLYRVAKNKITDRFRKKRTDSIEGFTLQSEDGELDFRDILLQGSSTPEDEFFRKIFWDELMDALDELPEKQREVFVLSELDGMGLQAIADMKKESIKTIISRKGYAVKHLREKLDNLYKDLKQY
jgi:RNA polymerase sigma factor (sigma-70 family)